MQKKINVGYDAAAISIIHLIKISDKVIGYTGKYHRIFLI
jgi:hypothetical protein